MAEVEPAGLDPALTRHCAVIGSPIGHSLSPVLHRAAYDHLHLPWTYAAYDVDEEALAPFLRGEGPRLPRLPDDWRGLSLTMPLKRAVLPLLDEIAPTARLVGSVNTVVRESDGRLTGDNTDVAGMVAALAAHGVLEARGAVVLGGGATATSAVAALSRGGVGAPVVVVRDPQRAGDLLAVAAKIGSTPQLRSWGELSAPGDLLSELLDTDLVVASTPKHATDALAAAVRTGGSPRGVLFDVVYDPWPTELAQAWSESGGTVIGGLDLLVHQAVLQVQLMTGYTVDPSVLHRAGEAALHARLVG